MRAFLKADRKNTFQLSLPDEVDKRQSRLNVRLEVNLGDGEGWDEFVEYRDGSPKFVRHSNRKTFEKAEATCVKDGGHLASVTTVSERDEVIAMSIGELTWLGGTYNATQGSWSWLDGKSWKYNNFGVTTVPKDEQKTKIAIGKEETNYKWEMVSPQAYLPFICRPEQKVFRVGL